MSKTLLNRLSMLELLDVSGPLTITELAARAGMDVSVVSRTIKACEPDGWVVRDGGRLMIGPRAALLGSSGAFADVIASAGQTVHALAGASGLEAHAYALVGADAVLIAVAAGRAATGPRGLGGKAPLHATAGARAIAAQLPPQTLDRLLGPEPFADAGALLAELSRTTSAPLFAETRTGMPSAPPLPLTRVALDRELEQIRSSGISRDGGSLHPSLHCIAAAWPTQGAIVSLACLGTPDAVATAGAVGEAALRAATAPGATPLSILAAALEPSLS